MPNFISKEGVWEPAHERHVDPKAEPGKEVYEGPDRAAVEVLKSAGVDHLGQHYSLDPEMIMRARQLGFSSVDEYLKMFNYDRKKAAEAYEQAKAKTVTNKPAERQAVPPIPGGGIDVSGSGKTRYGGFEHPSDAPGGKLNN